MPCAMSAPTVASAVVIRVAASIGRGFAGGCFALGMMLAFRLLRRPSVQIGRPLSRAAAGLNQSRAMPD